MRRFPIETDDGSILTADDGSFITAHVAVAAYAKELSVLTIDTQFLLKDPNGEKYSTTRITEKLNEACLEFCLRTQLIKEEINIQLLEDTYEYDIKTLVEENGTLRYFAFPLRLAYDGGNYPALLPGSLVAFTLQGVSQDVSGIPSNWYLCAVSPGVVQIIGTPAANGEALPSESDNLQVTYIAMPTEMTALGDIPDAIPGYFHKYLPFKAAALILEEGDKNDLALADYYESEFERGIGEQVAEESRGTGLYEEMRPL